MANKFIKESVDSGCSLSIWDPCPQSVLWKAGCESDVNLDAETKIAKERAAKVDTKSFMPEFYSPKAQNNCTEWHDLNVQTTPGDPAARKVAVNSIPQYSTVNTKFRFCIILAGPPGSGKSVMTELLKKDATLINQKAAKKSWVSLGHDQIICKDEAFVTALNNETLLPATEAPTVESMQQSILTPKSLWNNIMRSQNNLYDTFRGNIPNKKELRTAIINIVRKMTGLVEFNKLHAELREAIENNNDSKLRHLMKSFIESYTNTGAGAGTVDGKVFERPSNSELLYIKTALSIIYGFNITYETTLKNLASLEYLFELSSILTDGCQHFNYIFLLGFPVVPFNSLEERIMDRYLQWARLDDTLRREKCSVGIPDLTRAKFMTNMTKAYFTLASLIWFCTGTGAGETCPGVGIDYLLIFDNTGILPERYKYLIPISKRSYQVAPVGLSKQPQIMTRTKELLIAVLMRSLNCLKGGNCGGIAIEESKQDESAANLQSDCWTLPDASDMSLGKDDIGEEMSIGSSQDSMIGDWESGDALSFAASDYNFIQLDRHLDKILGPEKTRKLLTGINVIQAYKNLLDSLDERPEVASIVTSLRERAIAPLTKFEQLKKIYGMEGIRNYLTCISKNAGESAEVIAKDINKTEKTCTEQKLVPVHPSITLASPKAIPQDPLLEHIYQYTTHQQDPALLTPLRLPGSRSPLPTGQSMFADPMEEEQKGAQGGYCRRKTRKIQKRTKRRATRRR